MFIGHRIPWFLSVMALLLIPGSAAFAPAENAPARTNEQSVQKWISIEWENGPSAGDIRVTDGKLVELRVSRGEATIRQDNGFERQRAGPLRLDLLLEGTPKRYGDGSTLVSALSTENGFSFFLRDVDRRFPIYIPAYRVIVTERDDSRSYSQIASAVEKQGLQSELERMESEPEEDAETAARHTRSLRGPAWLGLSRDMRIFEVGDRTDMRQYREDWVQPRFHGDLVPLPEADNKPVRYHFVLGRGWGPVEKQVRRLDDGVLPILQRTLVDGDVDYTCVSFVALESSQLSKDTLRGTHYLVADGHSAGHRFTDEQQRRYEELVPAELGGDEETVLFARVEATNTASAPRYAWFRNVVPVGQPTPEWRFEPRTGFGVYASGRVFSVSKINGQPLRAPELAILLKPGETARFEFFLPHRPISAERARKLSQVQFSERLRECREFWKKKLEQAASIQLPERRVEEMVQAGLLHLDIVAYGLEPSGTLAPTIGVYAPIGTESAPIITVFDSMGWHDVARRSGMYFLEKQHDDGLIQNFAHYMVETGAALWVLGEHFRYTRDQAWVREIAPRLLKSTEYLLRWREQNKREELRGKGYGMLDGAVGDPKDPYHYFMLNGYAYLGLSRVAEMLAESNPGESSKLQKVAEELKQDIRASFFQTMAKSPVIPLGDGTWCPTVPPFVEYRGPLPLFAEGGQWYTHGSFMSRDGPVGAHYLVFQEVIDPGEPAADFMLNMVSLLFAQRNVVFTQPYYSRHPVIHLMRREVKPFLKAYYNGFLSLADRETYSFWEHFFGASPHKTHEEAWFLMQTRWMLYLERGESLRLLSGIPRAWLTDGQRIELKKAATYFGPLTLSVQSKVKDNEIEARIEMPDQRHPKRLEVRLPHPLGRRAVRADGGTYDPETETVVVEPFTGRSIISLRFDN